MSNVQKNKEITEKLNKLTKMTSNWPKNVKIDPKTEMQVLEKNKKLTGKITKLKK